MIGRLWRWLRGGFDRMPAPGPGPDALELALRDRARHERARRELEGGVTAADILRDKRLLRGTADERPNLITDDDEVD